MYNTESYTLVVVDDATGRRLWSHWLGDPLLAQPAASRDQVVMAWPARGKHLLGTLDQPTGERQWEAEIAADVISAPVIAGGTTWATTYDGAVTSVDLATA